MYPCRSSGCRQAADTHLYRTAAEFLGTLPARLRASGPRVLKQNRGSWGGCIIDQPFQPRLLDGMIRCYMGVDRVVGFGHQLVKALIPPPPEGPDSPAVQLGPRVMHGPDAEPFQTLREKMETEWTPQMMEVLE